MVVCIFLKAKIKKIVSPTATKTFFCQTEVFRNVKSSFKMQKNKTKQGHWDCRSRFVPAAMLYRKQNEQRE